MRLSPTKLIILSVLSCAVSAIYSSIVFADSDTSIPVESSTPLTVAQATPAPTATATATDTHQLVIWWPEPLAPVDQPDVSDLLNAQIAAFTTAEAENSECRNPPEECWRRNGQHHGDITDSQ